MRYFQVWCSKFLWEESDLAFPTRLLPEKARHALHCSSSHWHGQSRQVSAWPTRMRSSAFHIYFLIHSAWIYYVVTRLFPELCPLGGFWPHFIMRHKLCLRTHDGPMIEHSLCQTSERGHCIALPGQCLLHSLDFTRLWLLTWPLMAVQLVSCCTLSGCSHSVPLHAFWCGFQIICECASAVGTNEIAAFCFLYKFRLVWLLCSMWTLWFRPILYHM